MLELLFLKTENVTLMPLDENFNHKILCFSNKNVLLGLPEMKYNTYAFMNGFRNFVLQQINLLNVSKWVYSPTNLEKQRLSRDWEGGKL